MQYFQVYNLPIWYCIHCKMITTISLANISHHVRVASVMSDSLWPHGLWPIRFLCPWDFSGKNTRVGCGALLQGIFPGQGPNFHLLYLLQWQAGSLPLMPPGKLHQSLNIVIKKKQNLQIFSNCCEHWQCCFSSHRGTPFGELLQLYLPCMHSPADLGGHPFTPSAGETHVTYHVASAPVDLHVDDLLLTLLLSAQLCKAFEWLWV